jgi:hypothetical protein
MDVEDGLRAALEKFFDQTFDEDKWINCAFWAKPARCFGKYGCIQGMAKVPARTSRYDCEPQDYHRTLERISRFF